jgi:hypothetical protein
LRRLNLSTDEHTCRQAGINTDYFLPEKLETRNCCCCFKDLCVLRASVVDYASEVDAEENIEFASPGVKEIEMGMRKE